MGWFSKNEKGYPVYKKSGKLVHRVVAEKKIGGKIGRGRVVHHNDGNPMNFRKENLRVMGRSEHSKLHTAKRRRAKKSWF